jgi:hypothetical protein
VNRAPAHMVAQYGQQIVSGNFAEFDHGREDNVRRYGQTDPPMYHVQNVTVPVSAYFGRGDGYFSKEVTPDDVTLDRICTMTVIYKAQAHLKQKKIIESLCDISHRLGGINPFGVFSEAFPGLKMWVTFACATAIFLTYFIISIAVLETGPLTQGYRKEPLFHTTGRDRESNPGHLLGRQRH